MNSDKWIAETIDIFNSENSPNMLTSKSLNENNHLLVAIRIQAGPIVIAEIIELTEDQARNLADAFIIPFDQAKGLK